MWHEDQKYDVFKTAKWIVKTNQNIIGEQWINNNNNGVLTVSDEDRK